MKTMNDITGMDILALGIPSGKHIGDMLKKVRHAQAYTKDRAAIERMLLADWAKIEAAEAARVASQLPLAGYGEKDWGMFIDPAPRDPDEDANAGMVIRNMNQLMRVPVAQRGALMPDACPAGTISVGAVVASTELHPGWHSADICCSLFLSVYNRDTDPKDLLDRFEDATHFGNGSGPGRYRLADEMLTQIENNRFTRDFVLGASSQLGTQGDGNHFAYVGHLESTGQTTLVTHHGSRNFGAEVYRKGMAVAEQFRRELSPETPEGSAWIPADSDEGREYWEALQIVRRWTKLNHTVLHDAVGYRAHTRFWNEHNFVFQKEDGLFYHAKGATPTGFRWAGDATPYTIIPLNMAEPILIVEKHPDAPQEALEFAPHGAGRNYSRTEHKRRRAERRYTESPIMGECPGLDVRFYCGKEDISELPSAYKNAQTVVAEIERFRLARVVDRVMPFGSIMAGDHTHDAPWRVKARAKRKEARRAEKAAAHEALMKG